MPGNRGVYGIPGNFPTSAEKRMMEEYRKQLAEEARSADRCLSLREDDTPERRRENAYRKVEERHKQRR